MPEIDYWRAPGRLTDLAGHSSWVSELPDEPARLRELVASVIIHPKHPDLIAAPLTPEADAENRLRPAADIVAAIRARVPDPARPVPRQHTDRVVGVCRHFAVVFCALLRAKGVPARARVGVSGYLEPPLWYNHWITEWWNGDERRWIRADPQLDEETRAALPHDIDPDDLPDGAFLNAGENWLRAQSGAINPDDCCGVRGDCGIGFVRCNVVRDLAALNKVELLAWDIWGVPVQLYGSDLTTADADDLTDAVAAATADPTDVNRLRELFTVDGFAIPRFIITVPDSVPALVELDL